MIENWAGVGKPLVALSLLAGLAGCAAPRPTVSPGGGFPPCVAEVDAPLPGLPPGAEADAAALDRFAAEAGAGAGRVAACLQQFQESGPPDGLRQPWMNAVERQQQRLAELQRLRQEAERASQALRSTVRKESATRPPPPPPPPPPPAKPPLAEVIRYPAIEAPDEVDPGQELEVLVLLAEERISSSTVLDSMLGGDKSGGIRFKLPPIADDAPGWDLSVVLTAEGLAVRGANSQAFVLPRTGTSEPVRFKVRAGKAVREGILYATFYRGTVFLGRAKRTILIGDPQVVAEVEQTPARRSRASDFVDGERKYRAPDLAIAVRTGVDPLKKSKAEVIVADISMPGVPEPKEWIFPDGLAAVLDKNFASLADRSARDLVEDGDPRPAPARSSAATRDLVLGIGKAMWSRLPAEIQAALRRLDQSNKKDGMATVAIDTNEPLFPWELVALPSGRLLGQKFAVARAHRGPDGREGRPPPHLSVDGVALLAPAYAGGKALRAQLAEVEAIQRAALGGKARFVLREELVEREWLRRTLVEDRRRGAYVFHFAGHGKASASGARDYQLDLGREGLSAEEWSGLLDLDRVPPFLFLNACNLAKADKSAGLVEGWAPSSLAAGVTGYVGGLWPIGDRAASEAAGLFYRSAFQGIPVAEALRQVRAQFDTTFDPTYLAYVYYGDPDLRLEVRAR